MSETRYRPAQGAPAVRWFVPLLPSVLAGSGQSPTGPLFLLSGSRVRESFEMPDWTKKNFDDLRDLSPQDAQMQWRFAREALGSPELGVSRFTYDPGARMPWGHRHREQEEAYIVVAGSGRAKLDDEIVELSVWDVLRVAPAVVRSFEAGPEGLDVICIGGRKPEGGDTERFEDFWA